MAKQNRPPSCYVNGQADDLRRDVGKGAVILPMTICYSSVR